MLLTMEGLLLMEAAPSLYCFKLMVEMVSLTLVEEGEVHFLAREAMEVVELSLCAIRLLM